MSSGVDARIRNTLDTRINPATEEKQDSIIALLNGTDKPYIMRYEIDSGDSNIYYLGNAVPGTATSAASWQIERYDYTGGEIVTLLADGNDNFDNVWDSREALSYS